MIGIIKSWSLVCSRVFLLLFICTACFISISYGQENAKYFLDKYNTVVNAKNKQNSYDRILGNSKKGNSWYFMFICEVIDANNTMFKATGDLKYLKYNFDYSLGILSTVRKEGTLDMTWRSVSQNNYNKQVDNQEVLLFEGYIFRYLAEFYYIVSKLKENERAGLQLPVYELENSFLKWYKRSQTKYKDASDMYRDRTHIAALWANTALYLSKISYNKENIKIYEDFFQGFDAALKNNLKKKSENGHSYYVWNSTFDEPFTTHLKQLKADKKYPTKIQDVSHGNRVIQYVISAYEVGTNAWTRDDLNLFANTLKYVVYKNGAKKLPDNIDGTNISEKQFENTGWKQSDGWMKLMMYDQEIYPLVLQSYQIRQKTIDANTSNLQFFANFYRFLTKK